MVGYAPRGPCAVQSVCSTYARKLNLVPSAAGAGTRARLITVIFEASPAIHGVDLGDGEYDNYDEGYGFRY